MVLTISGGAGLKGLEPRLRVKGRSSRRPPVTPPARNELTLVRPTAAVFRQQLVADYASESASIVPEISQRARSFSRTPRSVEVLTIANLHAVHRDRHERPDCRLLTLSVPESPSSSLRPSVDLSLQPALAKRLLLTASGSASIPASAPSCMSTRHRTGTSRNASSKPSLPIAHSAALVLRGRGRQTDILFDVYRRFNASSVCQFSSQRHHPRQLTAAPARADGGVGPANHRAAGAFTARRLLRRHCVALPDAP